MKLLEIIALLPSPEKYYPMKNISEHFAMLLKNKINTSKFIPPDRPKTIVYRKVYLKMSRKLQS